MRTLIARDSDRFQKGQGLVEYGLVLVLVSVVVIVILSTLGGGVKQTLCRITMTLGGTCGECASGTVTGPSGSSTFVTFEAGVVVEATAQSAANIVNMMVFDPSSVLLVHDNEQSLDHSASASFTTSAAGSYQFYIATGSSPGVPSTAPWTLTYSGC